MCHHGDDPSVMLRHFGAPEGLGATGEFPRGQLNSDDEGALRIAISADPDVDVVLIDFGKPVAWIGFSAAEAVVLAETLLAKSRVCRDGRG